MTMPAASGVAAAALVAVVALLLRICRVRMQRDSRTVVVLVLGDIARSPRMCYHAASLLEHGFAVRLVGYVQTPLPPTLCGPQVRVQRLAQLPSASDSLPRALFPLVAVLKVLLQTATLISALLLDAHAPHAVLVQTPPAVPTLAVARMACVALGARLIIDWHNVGHTILALKLGERHPLVSLYAWAERMLGSSAHTHLFVTEAMRNKLVHDWQLRGDARVLYDRAPAAFRRASPAESQALFSRLELPCGNIFTERGGATPARRADRPALLVSSTSWTPDEEFSILLDALSLYEREARGDALPRLEVVITGKGPLKAQFERELARRICAEGWSHAHVQTAWLDAADYPVLLGTLTDAVTLTCRVKRRRHIATCELFRARSAHEGRGYARLRRACLCAGFRLPRRAHPPGRQRRDVQ